MLVAYGRRWHCCVRGMKLHCRLGRGKCLCFVHKPCADGVGCNRSGWGRRCCSLLDLVGYCYCNSGAVRCSCLLYAGWDSRFVQGALQARASAMIDAVTKDLAESFCLWSVLWGGSTHLSTTGCKQRCSGFWRRCLQETNKEEEWEKFCCFFLSLFWHTYVHTFPTCLCACVGATYACLKTVVTMESRANHQCVGNPSHDGEHHFVVCERCH